MTESRPDVRHKEEEASPAPAADGSKDRKQRILWIAVGGMTAVIVLLWVLLLPLQMRELKFGSMSDLAERWRVIRDENQPPASFRETLNKLHDRLVQSSAQDQAATAATAAVNIPVPAADLARLREKLEAINAPENTLIAPENAALKAQGTK